MFTYVTICKIDSQWEFAIWRRELKSGALWPRGVGGSCKREGTYVYLYICIHVDAWQKPTKYCKAIILQLKINLFFKKAQSQTIEFKKKVHHSLSPNSCHSRAPAHYLMPYVEGGLWVASSPTLFQLLLHSFSHSSLKKLMQTSFAFL